MQKLSPPLRPGDVGAEIGRVSEDDTDWGRSVVGQLARGRKQIQARHLVIRFTLEEIGSGSRFRVGANEHWESIKQHALDNDVRFFTMDRISRLSRNDEEGIPFLNRCRDNGIWLHFSKANQWKDPRIPSELEDMKHELVRGAGDTDQYSVDIIEGKASSRELGRPDGRMPWGLKRIWRESARYPREMEYDHTEWVLGPAPTKPGYPEAPSRQELVLEIIRRVAAHWSYTSVKRSLEQRGILTPYGRERWDVGTIKNIATDVLYLGVVPLEPATYGAAGTRGQRAQRKYGSYDENDETAFARCDVRSGPHDRRDQQRPVVTGKDIRTFWAAVARVEDKGEAFGGGSIPLGGSKLDRKVVHLLTCGTMTCGYVWPEEAPPVRKLVWGRPNPAAGRARSAPGTVCGSALRYGGKSHGRPYLTCDEWGHNTVPEELADEYVTALVQARIAWLLRAGFDGRGGDELLRLREERAEKDGLIREHEASMKNAKSARSSAALTRAIDELTGEVEVLDEKIRKAAVPVCLTAYDEIPAGPQVADEDLVAAVAKVWLKSTLEARKAVLGGIAESVTLRPGIHGYQSRNQDISERVEVAWVPVERFVPAAQLEGHGTMTVGAIVDPRSTG